MSNLSDLGVRLYLAPVLATAVLLLATGSSWRPQRPLAETIGLAAGVLLLTLALAGLPPVVFGAALPTASVLMTWLVLAGSEWQFAPDSGQSGWTWTIAAAARPALGAGCGAMAGFVPLLCLRENPHFPLLNALAVLTGLLGAHTLDRLLRKISSVHS